MIQALWKFWDPQLLILKVGKCKSLRRISKIILMPLSKYIICRRINHQIIKGPGSQHLISTSQEIWMKSQIFNHHWNRHLIFLSLTTSILSSLEPLKMYRILAKSVLLKNSLQIHQCLKTCLKSGQTFKISK